MSVESTSPESRGYLHSVWSSLPKLSPRPVLTAAVLSQFVTGASGYVSCYGMGQELCSVGDKQYGRCLEKLGHFVSEYNITFDQIIEWCQAERAELVGFFNSELCSATSSVSCSTTSDASVLAPNMVLAVLSTAVALRALRFI